MDRRQFLKTTMIPAAAAVAGLPRFASADVSAAGDWRVFEVTTEVKVLKPAGVTRVWLPVPLARDTDYQKSLGNIWTAEGGSVAHALDKKYHAGIISAAFPASAGAPALRLTSRFATRDRMIDFSKPAGVKEDPAVLKLNLEPSELIPTDGIVRDTAMKIVQGQRNNIDKARAIYEWMVDNTFRDAKVRGCGWGDIKSMLETGNLGGKCGDLSALFVGLARASGVPARDMYGVRVASSRNGFKSLGANSAVISKAQHCRAEFYAEGYGWIPVDPADVRKVVLEEPPGNLALTSEKVGKARKMLFGYWEMNWVAFNDAHDVQLPGSRGPKIPYLMYPNGETAQGRLDSLDPDAFKYTMTARELTDA